MRLVTPLLGILIALVASGPAARADPLPDCAASNPPQTAMQGGALLRASHVLLGEVEGVRNVRGMMLARVRPIRVIKGPVPAGGPLTVLIRGPRPTGDRERPSAPYLDEHARGRHVFFLRRNPDGVAYTLLTLFDATGELGAQKLAALVRHAELATIVDPEARGRETVAWLLDSQKAGGTWTRVHTARELSHLAGLRPDLFDDATRSRLRQMLERMAMPAQRRWLVQTLQALGDTTPVPAPPPSQAAGLEADLATVTTPKARIEAIRSFLHRGGSWQEVLALTRKEPPQVRLFVVTALADAGYVSALAPIRALYAFEDDARVLGAIVRAVGLLGTGEDVGWLADRLLSVRTQREALFALARIRTPEALDVLAAAAQRIREGGGAADDIGPLVEYLQSAQFVEVEAASGRKVGPKREL